MNRFLPNRISSAIRFLSLFAMVLVPLLTGCAQSDLITYAKDARKDGLALYKEGNFTEAAASFKNAVRQDPRDYQSFFDLGCCYDQLKQYQLSSVAYRSALDSMTVTAKGREDTRARMETLDALAWSMSQSQSREAEINTQARKAGSGTNPEDYFLLAKLYRFIGDVDASMDAYNRCTLLAPRDFSYAKEYGLYLMQLQQNDRAGQVLRRAYQIREDDRDVVAALGQLGITSVARVPGSDATTTTPKGPRNEWDYPANGNRPTPGRLSDNGGKIRY